MIRLPWFRMYSEARMDRKLACLKDDEFRVWFNLLCMASEQEERGAITFDDIDLLAIEVANGNPDLLGHTMSRLVTLHICDVTPQSVTFLNFEKRQTRKPSDTPERTRERKARSRLNTDMSHDVTRSHAQSRSVTRIEESRKEKKPSVSQRKSVPDDWVPTDAGRSYAKEHGMTDADIDYETKRFVINHQSKHNTFASIDKAWQTWCLNFPKFNHNGHSNGHVPEREYVDANAIGASGKTLFDERWGHLPGGDD